MRLTHWRPQPWQIDTAFDDHAIANAIRGPTSTIDGLRQLPSSFCCCRNELLPHNSGSNVSANSHCKICLCAINTRTKHLNHTKDRSVANNKWKNDKKDAITSSSSSESAWP